MYVCALNFSLSLIIIMIIIIACISERERAKDVVVEERAEQQYRGERARACFTHTI